MVLLPATIIDLILEFNGKKIYWNRYTKKIHVRFARNTFEKELSYLFDKKRMRHQFCNIGSRPILDDRPTFLYRIVIDRNKLELMLDFYQYNDKVVFRTNAEIVALRPNYGLFPGRYLPYINQSNIEFSIPHFNFSSVERFSYSLF
jgi:hypothetical protein